MWITKTSIQNPVFATMVMVALVVLGMFSYRELGMEAMPNVDIPGAMIEVNYPGASPEAVENDITRPIEEVVNTVSGIKTLRANSWEGRAGVYVDFELSTNMDKAMQDIRDKIAQVRPIWAMGRLFSPSKRTMNGSLASLGKRGRTCATLSRMSCMALSILVDSSKST